MCSLKLRLLGALLAGGGILLSMVVIALATGQVDQELKALLFVIVGYLCRDAVSWHSPPFPPGGKAPPGP